MTTLHPLADVAPLFAVCERRKSDASIAFLVVESPNAAALNLSGLAAAHSRPFRKETHLGE